MSCLLLQIQLIEKAFALARPRAGRSIAARIAMIAITTSSSIRVNARLLPARRKRAKLPRCIKSIWVQREDGFEPRRKQDSDDRRQGVCDGPCSLRSLPH